MIQRRPFLSRIGASALAYASAPARAGEPTWLNPALPQGTRDEATPVTLPGKQDLIRLTERPPNYETPLDVFREPITPNDRFFVRYHLAGIPEMSVLKDWSLTVNGPAAAEPATFANPRELQRSFAQVEVSAVCQCSGNRRGLFDPHVPGVQWGAGAMGNAVWRGVRLRDVLRRAGIKDSAKEIWFRGMDEPVLPATPVFEKSLPVDKAMSEDVIIALAMNGQPLPHLNGYPARLIVPGWTATYWVKHLSSIVISETTLQSFWMQKAYRVPARLFPVEAPFASQSNDSSWPITEMLVNSIIAEPADGDEVKPAEFVIRGVAWDRGHGIRRVEVSLDGGATWADASLGEDLGRYAFRAFTFTAQNVPPGKHEILARATSMSGETQSDTLKRNPAGYHHNVPQSTTVTAA